MSKKALVVIDIHLKKIPEMLEYYADKGCEVKPLAEYRI